MSLLTLNLFLFRNCRLATDINLSFVCRWQKRCPETTKPCNATIIFSGGNRHRFSLYMWVIQVKKGSARVDFLSNLYKFRERKRFLENTISKVVVRISCKRFKIWRSNVLISYFPFQKLSKHNFRITAQLGQFQKMTLWKNSPWIILE